MQAFSFRSNNVVKFNLFQHLFLTYLRVISLGGSWTLSVPDYSVILCINDLFPKVQDFISRRESFEISALTVHVGNVSQLPTKLIDLQKRSSPLVSPAQCYDFHFSLSYPGCRTHMALTRSVYACPYNGRRSGQEHFLVPFISRKTNFPFGDESGDLFTQRLMFPCWRFSFPSPPTPPLCLFHSSSRHRMYQIECSSVEESSPLFYAHLVLSLPLWASFGNVFSTYISGLIFIYQILLFRPFGLPLELSRLVSSYLILLEPDFPDVSLTYLVEFYHN